MMKQTQSFNMDEIIHLNTPRKQQNLKDHRIIEYLGMSKLHVC